MTDRYCAQEICLGKELGEWTLEVMASMPMVNTLCSFFDGGMACRVPEFGAELEDLVSGYRSCTPAGKIIMQPSGQAKHMYSKGND